MISFENVAKVYDAKSRPALEAVTLDVARDEFVFLVGASGSGKSTLLQLVLREQRATKGRVLVAGRDVAKLPSWKVPHLRRQIGAVFQDFRLLPNKTVFENVAFALQVIGKSRSHIRTTVPEVLETVGLGDKMRRMPHELSGGEQQRVAIARAIANKPVLLLADEPTGNLDPTTSLGIMRVLDRINRAGTTVVMATHDDTFVNAMRKRVIELSEGRIVRDEDFGEYTTTHIPVVRLTPPEAEIVAQIEAEEALAGAEREDGWVPAAPEPVADSGTESEAETATAGHDELEAVVAPEDDDTNRIGLLSRPQPAAIETDPVEPAAAEAVTSEPGTAEPDDAHPVAAEPVKSARTSGIDDLTRLADQASAPPARTSSNSDLARHLADRLRPQPVTAADAVPADAVPAEAATPGSDRSDDAGSDETGDVPAAQASADGEPDPVDRRERRARRAQRSGLFRRR